MERVINMQLTDYTIHGRGDNKINDMQINFEIQLDSQLITVDELNEFQTIVGNSFPEDYREHMIIYNGGDAIELNTAHISNSEGGS